MSEQDFADDEATVEETVGPGFLTRIRNEFQIEFLVACVCFILGFGLTTKVAVGITMACLRFAVPDVITAILVVKSDPDRWHGIAVGLLFIAMGMCRSATVAFCVVMAFGLVGSLVNLAPGPVLATSVISCLLVVYAFMLLIFPCVFLAYVIAEFSGIKLYFAQELTRLRRTGRGDFSDFDIHGSLRLIAVGSGVSLSIVIASTSFIYALFPKIQAGPEVLFILIGAAVAPFIWIGWFSTGVSPEQPGLH